MTSQARLFFREHTHDEFTRPGGGAPITRAHGNFTIGHRFTATELEREKRNLLRVYDQALAENDKDESAPLAAEYIRNFLTGESLPGITWEPQMHVRFLPGITMADVNALAKEWNGDHIRVVAVSL